MVEQLDLFSSPESSGHFTAWLSSVRFWLYKLPSRVAVTAFDARPAFDAGKSPRETAEAVALKAGYSRPDIIRCFGLDVHGGY